MVRWLPRTTCTSTSRSPTAKARRAISPGSSPARLPSAVMVTRTAATPHARSRSTLAVQRTAGWLRYANSSLLVHSRKPPRSRSRWASGVIVLTLCHWLVATAGRFACRRVGPIEPPPPPPPGTHVGWYVTATGTSGGDGTNAQPWDLQTALSGGNGKVQVGDTIWLRQGTYHGTFYSGLSGVAGSPIVVRAYPGERATIDGGTGGANRIETLTVSGRFTYYWDLEIMQSSTARLGEAGTGTPLRPT